MLVLSRKVDEKIQIGPNITITVVRIKAKAGSVQIGIEAPGTVRVLRAELAAPVDRRDTDEAGRESSRNGDRAEEAGTSEPPKSGTVAEVARCRRTSRRSFRCRPGLKESGRCLLAK